MEKLSEIQQKLKAPKGQFNKFGKYKYRSCEDILEGVKPLLDGAIITITDELLKIGDRYYIKATALFSYKGESVSVSAYAREDEHIKGMHVSQVTGATSSYARKYALNGLLLIDDNKDADNDDNRNNNRTGHVEQNGGANKIKEADNTIRQLIAKMTDKFKDESSLMEIYQTLKVANYKEIEAMNLKEKDNIIKFLEGMEALK